MTFTIAFACALIFGCALTFGRREISRFITRIFRDKREYKYRALSSAASQIRLIVLQPGVEADPINVTVRHAFLFESPFYEALSYTWGNPSVTTAIWVDGEEFQATTNLECALRHLRMEYEPRILWVDAICINQSDISERSQQVGRMKDIFAKTARVLVWLGPEDDNSNAAMDAISKDFAKAWLGQSESKERIKIFKDVLKLLQRPWWSRSWVVQEVLSQGKVLVICGLRAVPWTKVISLYRELEYICKFNPGNGGRPPDLDLLVTVARLRYMCQGAGIGADVLVHLRHLRHLEASDARDKVWVAFTIIGQSWMPRPDYSLSLIRTYHVVVSQYIQTYENLDILEHCHGQGSMGYILGYFPSWIPDWRVKSIRISFTETSRIRGKRFAATRGSKPIYKISYSSGLHFLQIFGFILDRISSLQNLEPSPDNSYALEDPTTLLTQIGETYRSGEATRDVLKRVESADMPAEPFPRLGVPGADFLDLPEQDQKKIVTDLLRGTETAASGRKLMISQNGYMGLVPDDAQKGDLICILSGGNTPFVLRSSWGRFRLVGSCYVHGVMHGEALTMLTSGETTYMTFPLF